MAIKKPAKTGKFDLRLSEYEQSVIKRAASLKHTTPTTFIRQQAVTAAEGVIHDQTRFVVNEEQWLAIESALSRPARNLPLLKTVLNESDEWDK